MSFRAPLRIFEVFAGLTLLAGCAAVEDMLAHIDPAGSTAPPAAAAKRPPALSPRTLVGNSEEQVVAMLGKPGSVREEPPAMVWQYRAKSGCSVDVFFYFDVASEEFRSLAYKFSLRKAGRGQEEECLALLRSRNQVAKDKKD